MATVTAIRSKEVRRHPSQNFPQQQTNPAENQKPPAPERGTPELPFVVRSLAPEKTQQEAEDDARERNDKRWNDRAALVIGVGTLLILIVQAIAFFVQALRLQQTIEAMKKIGADQSRDMQASIAVADKAANAATQSADAIANVERPYLFILPKPSKIAEKDGPADLNPTISYSVINFGRVPAIIRLVYTQCFQSQ